ncbi:adenosylcobinamide-GDP ribazoletransferase [Antarctobacter jejuensis]|uniref:adenosylcobinamide-GDP ribazoletransferase n=1 Tax=Antarctobacter jejuensis TaxID=1439938 RepID=UPI003FD18631
MTLRRRMNEMRLAMMMMTRLPMGQLRVPVPTLAEARWAFPLCGLPVGLLGWAAFALAQSIGLAPLVAALAGLAAMATATGGLHQDGLADFVDGMGGRDRAHRLEIMRDSRIGSYGVIALIFVTALSAGAFATMPVSAWAGVLLIAVSSRLVMLVVLDSLPAARPDGLGKTAANAGASWRAWLPGLLVVFVLGAVLGVAALTPILAIMTAALFVAWRAKRLLGGQTGDVLGAVQLTTECAGWLALSAVL